MGQWFSNLWPEAPNPSLVEIEARQRAEADAEQAGKDAEAAQAAFATLIQAQESQKKAMEDKLAAIQAAQEHAHREMMAKVEAERAANEAAQVQAHKEMMTKVEAERAAIEAAQAQAHKEMMAMIEAERAVNEARSMAQIAAQAANDEARRKAAEEDERKRIAAAEEQVERDARQVQAREETMAIIEAERAARWKAETAAHEEAKQRATAEAQEQARKAEEAAKEHKRKTDEAADAMKKAAEEKVKKAKEDAERKLKEEVKKVEEDAERKSKEETKKADAIREDAERRLKVEVEKANAVKEDAQRKLNKGIQPVVTPTREEVRDTKRRAHYREDCFHLAVAGVAGGGKSSLINAFRGLRNKDIGSAATGITETTTDITIYANPNADYPYVWYDIPGAGTLKIPDWQYFNNQGLYIFDCIIVMVDNRFTTADIAILINCRRFNIPAYIVRSKADQHIRNVMEDLPVGSDSEDEKLYQTARDKFIRETRRSVKVNLEDANIPDQKVYIISKETMVGVVKEKWPDEVIDEIDLLYDLVREAQARRGRRDVGAVTTAIKEMIQSLTSF